ncbi:MAG: hypothetical protein ACLFSC_01560 [Wenzhouxiangella sp.]
MSRGIGSTIGRSDASEYKLAGEIQASIDDPRPGIRHDEVMSEMDADIAGLPETKRVKQARQQAT